MSEVLSPIPPSSQPSNVTNIASVSSTGATALTRHDHIAIELSATATGHTNANNGNGNGRAMTPIDHTRFPSLHTPIATRTSSSSATTAATFVNVNNGASNAPSSSSSSSTNGTSREVKEEKLSIRVIGSPTATATTTAASPSSGSGSASTGGTLITTPPNIPINVSLPATGSKIWLVEHDGTRHQWVSGQTEDAFSLDSLDDMIRRRWAAGKSCIIAAVPTRDKEKVGFSTTSYYDAFAANRLLFKKIPIGNGLLADVVHRYHRSHPISVLNPLTNSPIIGEVKYYSVDPRASLISTPNGNGNAHGHAHSNSNSNGMNDISLVEVDARFIGTDYNFAFSNDVRKRFADAAFEPEDQLVVDLAAALQNPVERRPDVPLNGGAAGGGGMMVDGGFLIINGGQLDMMAPANANGEGIAAAFPFAAIPIIDVPYARALMFGVMIAFYFLVAFLIVQKAVVSLMDGSDTSDPQGWYWSFLPFFSFAVDRLIATMHRVREGRRHMAMKFFIWIAYFLFPTVVFTRDSSQYSVSRDARDVAFPLAMIAYSIGYYIILGLRHKLV